MAKEKKITVKFIPVKTRDTKSFMIYCRVTYDRKTTKFSVYQSMSCKSFEAAKLQLENVNRGEKIYPLSFRKQWVEKIIQHEISDSRKEYSIIGLGERMDGYQQRILTYLIRRFYEKLIQTLEDKITIKEFKLFESSIKMNSFFAYTYIECLNLIVSICEKRKIKPSAFIDESMIDYLIATGAYLAKHDVERRDFETDYKGYDKEKLIGTIGFSRIGDWVINENRIKSDFRDFVSNGDYDFFEIVDKFSNGSFSLIVSDFKIEKSKLSKQILSTIDVLIDEVIGQ